MADECTAPPLVCALRGLPGSRSAPGCDADAKAPVCLVEPDCTWHPRGARR